MDQFGISTAMRGMAKMYFSSARQSGRTTQMLDSLKDGDRIVCLNEQEARRLKGLCRERKLNVQVLVCLPHSYQDLFRQGTPQGRTVLDHSWVEQLFLDNLESTATHIDKLQTELSGYGEAHRETARQYRQPGLWHLPDIKE